MTESKFNKKSKPASNQQLVERVTEDKLGIPRVVIVPSDEPDPSIGIPVSLDLSPLFGHMPAPFQADLVRALHAQGLIKPADYFQPGASDRFRAAMLTVIKHDFLSVQALAKEENPRA